MWGGPHILKDIGYGEFKMQNSEADQHFRKAVKYAKTNSCSIKTLCACALTV